MARAHRYAEDRTFVRFYSNWHDVVRQCRLMAHLGGSKNRCKRARMIATLEVRPVKGRFRLLLLITLPQCDFRTSHNWYFHSTVFILSH
jgi:hypothetical protein